MAKQTTQLIQEEQAGLTRLEEELESARAVRDQYNRDLYNSRRRLHTKQTSPAYPNSLAETFIKDMKKGNVPEATLVKYIDSAIETNQEFDLSIYKAALYSVANNKDIYKYVKNGEGWTTAIDVQIVFEEEAGLMNDWVSGIEKYRETVLHSKGLDSEIAGEKATEFWFTKVYGSSLNTKTIGGRIELSGKKAPFWQILNSGTPPSLGSDRPGGYNPIDNSVPTDFIGDAQTELETQFQTTLESQRAIWEEEAQALQELINQYQERRDSYTQLLRDIRTDMRLNERIFRSFDDNMKFADKNKIADAIVKYRAGEEFGRATIDFSKAGKGKLSRYSFAKFEGLIRD